MEPEKRNKLINTMIIIFFVNVIVESVSEIYLLKSLLTISKLLHLGLLFGIYYYKSIEKKWLFFLLLLTFVFSNIFYLQNTQTSLFYAIIFYSLQRIILLTIILKIFKIKDYIPFVLATIPFFIIFFYLFFSNEVPQNSYYIIIFINCTAVVLGGVAVSNYMMNDTQQSSLLLISVLLFLGLQMVAYIERYYFAEAHSAVLRVLEVVLRSLALYSFYEFLIASEKLNDN